MSGAGRTLVQRCWPFLLGVVALLVAGLGLSRSLGGDGHAASAQFGVAAAVLSVYTSGMSLLATDRDGRTLLSNLIRGGAVPVVIAVLTAVTVVLRTHSAAGLLAGVPWLAGLLASVPLGLLLPDFLRFGAWRRSPD